MFPAALSDITLEQWISYTEALQPLETELTLITGMPDCKRKKILLHRNFVDKAFESAIFFGVPGELFVDEVLQLYEAFCSLFNGELPELKLPTIAVITFGHFIDLKMILQAGADGNKWHLLQYVVASAIFPYRPESLSETSDEFQLAGDISLLEALAVNKWWEELNTYINDNYPLFHDTGEDEGQNMKQHMEEWGWINFLKSVAKTKVFDLPGSGLNSIECARVTKLEEVLVWASEEKSYNLAVMRDMQK